MSRTNHEDSVLITDTRNLPGQIRLVDSREDIPDDQQSRLVTPYEAHEIRMETGLDLIMVSPEAEPPVIKLIDYGKFRFEQQKKQKEIARKQRQNARDVKEFYFNLNIGDHDYQTKINQIRKALPKHDVRVGVKNNRTNRMSLPRGMNLRMLSNNDDFIIRRIISELGEEVVVAKFDVGDRMIFADLKKAA